VIFGPNYRAVVVYSPKGRDFICFEPMAAVYPSRCLPLVQECLRADDLSMQAFVRQALALNLVAPWDLTPEDAALFRNVNTPGDLGDD